MNARRTVTTLATCLLFAGSAAWGQSTYGITELGTLPGTEWSLPQGASDDGSIVVGTSFAGTLTHGFVWSLGGGMQSLTLPGDDLSGAFVHSSEAVVTGQSCNANTSRCHGIVWSTRGRGSLTLPGDTDSSSGAVSADGSVVLGQSVAPDRTARATRWTHAGGLASLGTPAGYIRTIGNALSADGSIVVGDASNVGFLGKAFLWSSAGGFTLIDPLPGDAFSSATYVSPDGSTVSGESYYPEGPYQGYLRAFVWDAAGGLQPLVLPGDYRSGRNAVSSDGSTIVGTSCDTDQNCRAFIWTADTGVVGLPSLAGTTSSFPERGVSADGTTVAGVSCLGDDCTGGWRGWVWTAALGTVELGPLPGDATSQVSGASADVGVVSVNSCDTASACRAYLWVRPGAVVPLMLPGYSRSYVNDVAKNGAAVVGEACDASYAHCEVFVWTPDGGVEPLNLPGYVTSFTGQDAVSHDGKKVVGGACDENYLICEPFIWTKAGGVEPLGLPSGDVSGYPNGISANGSIAYGESFAVDITHRQSVVWTLGQNEVPTPAGDDVTVEPVVTLPEGGVALPVQLTFDSVASAGTTTVTASTDPSGGAPLSPPTFSVGDPPVYYDVDTTANFAGPILLCFSWQEGQFDNEGGIALFHFENDAWQNVTTSLDINNNKVCGQVNGLSPFALFERTYAFSGFFQPVDNLPTRNTAKAGAAIPIKFSLSGNQGLTIFTAGYPASQAMTCDDSTASDLIEETLTASANGLTYDAASDQYTYVWKTSKGWSNTCRLLVLKLNDGGRYTAEFGFK